jgi:hypothetical protein
MVKKLVSGMQEKECQVFKQLEINLIQGESGCPLFDFDLQPSAGVRGVKSPWHTAKKTAPWTERFPNLTAYKYSGPLLQTTG